MSALAGGARLRRFATESADYPSRQNADYGPFDNLGKVTIVLALICEIWPDMIRLAGSLELGHQGERHHAVPSGEETLRSLHRPELSASLLSNHSGLNGIVVPDTLGCSPFCSNRKTRWSRWNS